MHVYLHGFLNHVMHQEVSGVIQRDVIESFFASVLQLCFRGSKLQLFPELVLQCHCAPFGCSAVGDIAVLPKACTGSIFKVFETSLTQT